MDKKWDSQVYARNAAFVPALGAPVLEWLGPRSGERVLDLGCGDGTLTLKLIEAGCEVVGVDASPSMVEAATVKGVAAHLADARKLQFSGEFDAVFSNAVLHWVQPPETAAASVWQALRPYGRFVGEFGGHGNIAAICVALMAVLPRYGIDALTSWSRYYPTPTEYRAVLEGAGFTVERIELIPRPTPLPTGMRGWLATFADSLLALVPEDRRGQAVDEVEALLAPVLRDSAGNWTADYVRLRFAARKQV